MTHPQEPSDPDDDIDRWVDELAGRRPASTASTEALRQAIARRSTLEAERLLGDAASPEAQQLATQRLRERLRQDRESAERGKPVPDILPVVRSAGSGASNERRWRLVATFAVLALFVGTVWQLRGGNDGDFRIADGGATVWRDLAEPPRVVVAQPAQAAQALAKQVAPFGARPALYRESGNVLVDFEVQPEQAEALTAGIQDARIRAVVRIGANRVVFVRGS